MEVNERIEFVRDTVWRDFPLIVERVTVRADSSRLENRYATSDARINLDGSLSHSLATKPQREPIPIDRPVEDRDSIVYRDRKVDVEKIVEVERDLSWWQQTQIGGFWVLLAALAVALRKKWWTLVKQIL